MIQRTLWVNLPLQMIIWDNDIKIDSLDMTAKVTSILI